MGRSSRMREAYGRKRGGRAPMNPRRSLSGTMSVRVLVTRGALAGDAGRVDIDEGSAAGLEDDVDAGISFRFVIVGRAELVLREKQHRSFDAILGIPRRSRDRVDALAAQ